MNIPSQMGGGLMLFVVVGFWVVSAIVHILFALAVSNDARRLTASGRNVVLVSGTVWAWATLLGGAIVAGIYWLVHHSSLRPSG